MLKIVEQLATLQVHRRSIHAVVEAFQDEGAGGKGSLEIPRAGAQGNWGRCDSVPQRRVREAHFMAELEKVTVERANFAW